MSDWAPKRFWKNAEVAEAGQGYEVLLDGRGVRTPAKSRLVLPTAAMAEAVAEEWLAQEERVDPVSMPVTRSANAAIDKVLTQHEEVVEIVAAYGESDLLCYRAEGPEGLVARQAAGWDPMLDWAREALGVEMRTTTGVMYVAQDPGAVAQLHDYVRQLDAFALTAAHDLVAMSGSLILGLAALRDAEDTERLWDLSRIDEAWQIEQWGDDEEAAQAAETKRQAFCHAKRFYDLSRDR